MSRQDVRLSQKISDIALPEREPRESDAAVRLQAMGISTPSFISDRVGEALKDATHTPEELLSAAAFRLRASRRSEPDARATLLRRFKDTVSPDRFEIIFRTFYPADGTPPTAEGISLLTSDERMRLREHEASVRATDFILRWVAYGSARTD